MSTPSVVPSARAPAPLVSAATQTGNPGARTDSAPVRAQRAFRIAVFSYGLPCAGQKRGGIEQVAHDLANALVGRGHAVTVFTYDPKPQDARYGTAALPGQRFVTSWVGRRMTMGYLGNVLALCPGYCDFDVIIAHGDSLLLPLTGKPVVRVMHGSALEEARTATSLGRKVLQYGVYVQELLTAALQRGTVGVSANTRLSNRFVRTIIQNGVDLGRFASNDADRSPHPSILFVGALAGRKRGAWLVHEFVRAIQPEFPNAKLHIVATPDEPVPGVTYHTGLTRDELDALYRSAWVYASPSTYEGFGLPYVEAMASGVPVVATPNPGSCEVLDNGRYGCLMDDDRFADAVCELLRDNSRRAELAALGRERARAFDIARSAFAYEQLIARMVVQHD